MDILLNKAWTRGQKHSKGRMVKHVNACLHQLVHIVDGQADATAAACFSDETWNGRRDCELRRGITCWRDFPISDFPLQLHLVASEGLVIFGI
jgi:hypothetical protein